MKTQTYTSKLTFIGNKLEYVPITAEESKKIDVKNKKELKLLIASIPKVKTPKFNKGNCGACDGSGYFPRLFENNIKCPHCDLKGNTN